MPNFIEKEIVISAPGKYAYVDGEEKKTLEEFEKTLQYFDTIPLIRTQ